MDEEYSKIIRRNFNKADLIFMRMVLHHMSKNSEPKMVKVGDISIGGAPVHNPPVLIGGLFQRDAAYVQDHQEGIFDKKRVLKIIERIDDLEAKFALPHIYDILALSPTAMIKYIEFVADNTNHPFQIDSSNVEVRIAGLKYAREAGLSSRCIYNSIGPQIGRIEQTFLAEYPPHTAILLALNTSNQHPEGRLQILESHLFPCVRNIGINQILVDTVVLDIPSIGLAASAISLVKNKTGYPSGCAPANATFEWRKKRPELFEQGFKGLNATATAFVVASNADFVIYGPTSTSQNVFRACAFQDAINVYTNPQARQQRNKNRPLYKIF